MLLYAFTIPFARRMAKPLRRFALGLPARSPLKTGPRSGFPGAPALLIGKASLGSSIREAVTMAEGAAKRSGDGGVSYGILMR